MKKFTLFLLMVAFSISMMAQNKLTPQAQLMVERQKAKIERQATRAKGQDATVNEPKRLTLVVSVSDATAETFSRIKAAGGEIRSRLGRQVVVSIPIDSLDALQQIEGVQRIDKGHKGHLKTDVTRQQTGVSLLNGPSVPEEAIPYTGKGVTICLIDIGFDYQHPAFKDAEGNSRIKCVYMMDDYSGHPFKVDDPEAGEISFPGSVFDTPELIASLTTDNADESHGTHTAGIAAGSLSPLGFGGMAPEADIVLVPVSDTASGEMAFEDENECLELAIAFVAAYAKQCEGPVVLSASLNSHTGPHNGTGTVVEAIEKASDCLIPVFSAGNEGDYPVHLYEEFTASHPSVKTLLLDLEEDETGEYEYSYSPDVVGYTTEGSEVSIQLKLKSINTLSGRLNTVWSSEVCTATPGCDDVLVMVSSDDDAVLAKYFDGDIDIYAIDMGDGRLSFGVRASGGMTKLNLFELVVNGAPGTKVHMWDDGLGFGGVDLLGLSGYVDGDSEMSAGDWTTTERVVSVGAYCANVMLRDYDGNVSDSSEAEDPDDNVDVMNDIAWFSSYGTSINGVSQPTICAPGVNVVSAYNHYYLSDKTIADNMQWMGYPYTAESGTSMSCPVVAGIVALWLQANSDMTLDDIKEVMLNSSVNDSFTVSQPDRWGYGKINAVRGINYITTGDTGIRTFDYAASRTTATYDLQGRRISHRPTAGIYIRDGRKIVVR